MNSKNYLDHIQSSEFRYFPAKGVGFCPLHPERKLYDSAYLDEYIRREGTEIGHQLNQARYELTKLVPIDLLIDIGVGSGAFVRLAKCYGYDINPFAISMLINNNQFIDPYKPLPIDRRISLCFWDSLEHIEDPSPLLNIVNDYVFVSMPIYRDMNHILKSKHYKPNEHCWYFTEYGLRRFMAMYGFQVVAESKVESQIGREDIESFIFKKAI